MMLIEQIFLEDNERMTKRETEREISQAMIRFEKE
jgi:hypothetical protein